MFYFNHGKTYFFRTKNNLTAVLIIYSELDGRLKVTLFNSE